MKAEPSAGALGRGEVPLSDLGSVVRLAKVRVVN